MTSRRRTGPKIKPTSRRTIQDFEAAVRQHQEALGKSGFGAEERLFNARFALYELVQNLEAAIEALAFSPPRLTPPDASHHLPKEQIK